MWFYYSKAVGCCAEVRALLNGDGGGGALCPPDPALPCREYVGNCADLQEQFQSVQGALPADYVCRQARARSPSLSAQGKRLRHR